MFSRSIAAAGVLASVLSANAAFACGNYEKISLGAGKQCFQVVGETATLKRSNMNSESLLKQLGVPATVQLKQGYVELEDLGTQTNALIRFQAGPVSFSQVGLSFDRSMNFMIECDGGGFSIRKDQKGRASFQIKSGIRLQAELDQAQMNKISAGRSDFFLEEGDLTFALSQKKFSLRQVQCKKGS